MEVLVITATLFVGWLWGKRRFFYVSETLTAKTEHAIKDFNQAHQDYDLAYHELKGYPKIPTKIAYTGAESYVDATFSFGIAVATLSVIIPVMLASLWIMVLGNAGNPELDRIIAIFLGGGAAIAFHAVSLGLTYARFGHRAIFRPTVVKLRKIQQQTAALKTATTEISQLIYRLERAHLVA